MREVFIVISGQKEIILDCSTFYASKYNRIVSGKQKCRESVNFTGKCQREKESDDPEGQTDL